ncbi:Ribonuclease H-like domain containing protein [Trema orientale]|uniref:Ribonuclease H-like domain containing protein n=1 Tax=Trema orientale TaxID=63057 RepID=A0A2P5B032_TREOI|nr:Ribonuclease H-like domain containing protein [Trema orientale]
MTPKSAAVVSSHWRRPALGCLKLNVDAAVFEGGDAIGIGGIIRDSEGVILTCWALKVTGRFDILSAELIAIREGIRLAIDFGCPLHEIESDSLLAVHVISQPQPFSVVASIVQDIIFLISSAGYGFCQHILRASNMVVHDLASFVICSLVNKVWGDSCPYFIKICNCRSSAIRTSQFQKKKVDKEYIIKTETER